MDQQDYILGLAILGHDTSLTAVNSEGDVVFVAEEERYSRIKRGQFVFHPDLVLEVLNEYKIDPSSIRVLAIAGNPSAWATNAGKWLSFSWEARARHLDAWVSAFQAIFPNLVKTRFIRHHRAHAASAFFASPWEKSAVITLDGFGDGETATISYGRGSSLKSMESQPFPHSLPYMYHAFARWLGLDGHERDGKLMALAAYGYPSEEQHLREALSVRDSSVWRIAREFLDGPCKSAKWAEILGGLLGPKRQTEDPLSPEHYLAAASMQSLLESELLSLFRRARELTGASKICCAGGAFLNCRANGVLQRSGIFDSVFFQPLSADSGLSLGAALQAAREAGCPPWHMRHARLGSDLDLKNLSSVAASAQVGVSRPDDVVEAAARLLAGGEIIGWCQGRLEAGPRSLCGRSLLADPRLEVMRDRLNEIKRREPWRPFAPVMLEEETPAMFGRHISAPFMNVAFQVKDPSIIPAAVHVDGTCRLQTVSNDEDPLTTRLLRRFRELTGVGALVNTSLNVRGIPIARTVSDCMAFLCETKVDAMFVGDYMVERTDRTKPIELDSSPQWGQLPSPFVLATLDPDGSLEPRIKDLVNRSHGRIELSVNRCFELFPSPATLRTLADKKIVLLLPGYSEVWVETLPRALAWAIRMESHCSGLWLADLNGKVIDSASALCGLVANTLERKSLSDVELHYLRRAARQAHHSTKNREYVQV